MTGPFLVHYSRGEPFRSLSGASPEERDIALAAGKVWGAARFKDPDYFPRRLETERRLRDHLMAHGGRPELSFPYYCFLGRNSRFEENPANRGFKIDLGDLPPGVLTFTYGDSLLAHPLYRPLAGESYTHELCERIFLTEALPSLIASLPENSLHIECQLWIQPAAGVIHEL